MAVIHILKDGSVRNSIEGIVIKEPAFYQIINNLPKKKEKEK